MKLYINGIQADFTLEDEKSLGDFLRAFQTDCEKNNATIVSICIDGKNIPAEKLDSIFDNSIDETNKLEIETVAESDIIQSLQDLAKKLEFLCTELLEIPLLLQSGKDSKISGIVRSFADSFDILCRLVSLCGLFPQRFINFKIDGQILNIFLADFSPILADFESAMSEKDTVLIGDLAEYEIVPRLRSFIGAINGQVLC